MKVTQILYLLVFVGVIVCIVTSTRLVDPEGFEDIKAGLPVNTVSEPTIAKGVEPTRLSIQAMPNASQPGTLPFAPYGQEASVGSYQYQDPAQMPATFQQISSIYQDIRTFLVFEGVSISNSSDPSVQLPLTQLRADSQRLEQELAVLKKNPGVQSSLTQQNTADIQGGLVFLQRKVRLFQTAGVVNTGVTKEGFTDASADTSKTRATQADLQELATKVYAAILTLSSSGTTDLVVQARITKLQRMYSDLQDMITKLDNGTLTPNNIPLYKEDINAILPNLADPSIDISSLNTANTIQNTTNTMQNAANSMQNTMNDVLTSIKDNGMVHVNIELGYNGPEYNKTKTSSNPNPKPRCKAKAKAQEEEDTTTSDQSMHTSSPFDSAIPGAEQNNSKVGGLDWKNRAETICEQVRLRGLDPLDFGCLAKGTTVSPAYSWRGYTKMICGRLGATMDPNLPIMSGCPPQRWAGWNLY